VHKEHGSEGSDVDDEGEIDKRDLFDSPVTTVPHLQGGPSQTTEVPETAPPPTRGNDPTSSLPNSPSLPPLRV